MACYRKAVGCNASREAVGCNASREAAGCNASREVAGGRFGWWQVRLVAGSVGDRFGWYKNFVSISGIME